MPQVAPPVLWYSLVALPELGYKYIADATFDGRNAVVLVTEKKQQVPLLERVLEQVVAGLRRREGAARERTGIRKHDVDGNAIPRA